MNKKLLKEHLVLCPVTYEFTLLLGPVTTLHDFGGVLGRPLETFWGSHNFMVTAFASCVKWPLGIECKWKVEAG